MDIIKVEDDAARDSRPSGGIESRPRMEHQSRTSRDQRQMREAQRVLLQRAAVQFNSDAEFYGPRGSAAGRTRSKCL